MIDRNRMFTTAISDISTVSFLSSLDVSSHTGAESLFIPVLLRRTVETIMPHNYYTSLTSANTAQQGKRVQTIPACKGL